MGQWHDLLMKLLCPFLEGVSRLIIAESLLEIVWKRRLSLSKRLFRKTFVNCCISVPAQRPICVSGIQAFPHSRKRNWIDRATNGTGHLQRRNDQQAFIDFVGRQLL